MYVCIRYSAGGKKNCDVLSSPIVNVVCTYLRQVLGTSFDVATLTRRKGPDLFLQGGPF